MRLACGGSARQRLARPVGDQHITAGERALRVMRGEREREPFELAAARANGSPARLLTSA